MAALKDKVISGVFWSMSQQMSVKAVNFGIQIVLARILLPEAFGVIAMLQVFIAIGNSLMDSGMSSSLIRTKDADQRDYSTVFYINLLSSLVIYGILFLLAPWVAGFYKMPLLNPVVRLFGLTIIINALVSVQTARLTKQMNFKLQMLIEVPSVIVSGVVGIVMAYAGYGVWSLVWMNLAGSLVFMLQHWFRTGWRPQFIIDVSRLKQHFNFGYKLTFIGLGNAVYDNIYNVVIGKFFSAAQLGFYNRASSFQYFVPKNIGTAMQKVTYSTFAAIQDDNEKLKSAYKKIMQQALFWIAPVMITLCIIAEPLFRVVLTDKWLPAVPYFQVLTVSGVLYPINQYNLNILWVKGESGLLLKLDIWEKILLTIGIAISVFYGVMAIVIVQAVYSVVALFINSYYSGRFIQYPLREQLKDIWPVFMLSLFLGGVIWVINSQLGDIVVDWARIIIVCGASTVVYLTLSHLFHISPYLFIKKTICERINKR